jgi:hypothetical protein
LDWAKNLKTNPRFLSCVQIQRRFDCSNPADFI